MTAGLAIPNNAEEVTAEWIQRALSLGRVPDCPAISDIRAETIGSDSGLMSDILRCTLTYQEAGSSAPLSVIVKLPSSARGHLRIARRLSLYRREYECYQRLAPCLQKLFPTLLYGDLDRSGHRFVLVLEDLQGMENIDQLTGANAEQVRQVLRAAAELHGGFWNRLDRPPLSDFLASVGAAKLWLSQVFYLFCLPPCLERFGELFPDGMRDLAEAYVSRVSAHSRSLATGPQTLTHGDFRLDNMFFGVGEGDDFKVIDWQTTGLVGDALRDVAYFMVGSVATDVRRRVEQEAVGAYHAALCDSGVTDFTFDECWRRYRSHTLGMLLPTVCACGALAFDSARARRLGETVLRRTLAAIEDLDAAEFLPTGRQSSGAANALSMMSSCAYRTLSVSRRLSRHWRRPASA